MPEQTRSSVPSALSRLTHHRWALPALALVTRNGGCKFVSLSRELGASPSSLKRALDRLAELELVIRNPGYGHPLRPEYVVGPLGERTDGLPQEILDWMEKDGVTALVLRKWQLPVLLALGTEGRRFGEIRGRVPTATPRAVALALKSHASVGLITREVQHGYPPIPQYAPTVRALAGREPAWLLGEILAAG